MKFVTRVRLAQAAAEEGMTVDAFVAFLLDRLARDRKWRREHMRRKRQRHQQRQPARSA